MSIGTNNEYSLIKDYMTSHGFVWHRDSDYITEEPITQTQMIAIENDIKQQFPWFLPMSTKIYDAIINERSDVRARWLEEESIQEELNNDMEQENQYIGIE